MTLLTQKRNYVIPRYVPNVLITSVRLARCHALKTLPTVQMTVGELTTIIQDDAQLHCASTAGK